MSYTSGIYDDENCSGRYIDHDVGLVGYGTERGGFFIFGISPGILSKSRSW